VDAVKSVHPTDESLRAFGLGKLDDASGESVKKHLELCANCRQRVEHVSSDSFLSRLKAAQAAPDSAPPIGSSLPGLSDLAARPNTLAQASPSGIPPGLAEHPDYEVLSELGRGGMGVVYLAQNKLMGRQEVLKVVSREVMDRRGVLDRFLREIRNAAQLHHSNIVTAYSAFRAGEHIVFAMEYVEGYDLARMVKAQGPLPVAHACNFAYQAAQGLQYAHEKGMVHRDIKPSNLMLSRHQQRAVIKILDFGLAKATREGTVDKSLTHEGQMLGTPDFIAPEQSLDAQKADIRADIYSLGCTLYYLLTVHPPFRAASVYEVLQAHHSMEAKPLNLVRPDVPWELAAVVDRMMAKDPERRHQTPREVAQALKPFFTPQAAPGAAKADASQAERASPGREAVITASLLEAAGEGEAEPMQVLIPRAAHSAKTSRRPAAIAAALLGGVILILCGFEALLARRTERPPANAASFIPDGRNTPVTSNSRSAETTSKRARLPEALQSVTEKPRPPELIGKPPALKAADARDTPPPLAPKPPALTAALPLVRLKATDPEASDRLRRADIPDYELFAAGLGDRSKAAGGLVAIIGDSRLKCWNLINSIAFSRDGKTLLTAGYKSDRATIWDLADGNLKRSIEVRDPDSQAIPRFSNQRLAFSPDGQTVATAVYSFQQTEPPRMATPVRNVRWGRMRSTVRIWDIATGRARSILELGLDPQPNVDPPEISAIAFSPNGKFLAAGGRSYRFSSSGVLEDARAVVIVWDVKKRQRVLVKTARAAGRLRRTEVCFDRQAKTVFALLSFDDEDRGDILKAWNVDRGTEVPLSLEIPARSRLKSGRFDLWEIPKLLHDSLALVYVDKTRPAITDPTARPPSDAEQLCILDLTTRQERARLDITCDLGHMSIYGSSPDGTNLCLSVTRAHEGGQYGLMFWNLATMAKHWPKQAQRVWGIKGTYSPDGTKIALATNGVEIWDVAGGKKLLPRDGFHGGVADVSFSADGSSLAIASDWADSGVMIWDIAARRQTQFLEGCSAPVAFSPDGRRLATKTEKRVLLHDIKEGGRKLTLADWGHSTSWEDGVSCLAFSSDGASIGLGYGNGKVEVRDASTGEVRQQYTGIASRVESVAFSPDTRLLAACGEDSESHSIEDLVPEQLKSFLDTNSKVTPGRISSVIRVWTTATGQVFRTIRGPSGPVAFSGDGQILAAGKFEVAYKSECPLPLWDLRSGRLRWFLQCPEDLGTHHGFGPDGQTIATSGGGIVRLWNASTYKESKAIRICDPGGMISGVAFSPTGRYVATANGNGTVYILKMEDR
jgi:serine/threonine protein kinase/WD40 repeat protein